MVGETFEIYFKNDQKFLNFIHHGWRNIWNLVVSNNQKVFNSVQHDFVETYLSQMTKHGIYHFMQDIKQLLSNMLQVDGQTTSSGQKAEDPEIDKNWTIL